MTKCKVRFSALTEHCVEEKKQLPYLSQYISGPAGIYRISF